VGQAREEHELAGTDALG